jgi:hypothetical protein
MIIKNAIDERNRRLLMKFLLGGAGLGTAAGIGTSLVNYLQTINQENKENSDTSRDDDTLYLTLRNQNAPGAGRIGTEGKKKQEELEAANKWASIGGGLAISGGVLAGLGSYALVRQLYLNEKKKRAQKKLDEEQQAFYDTVSQEAAADKRASQWEDGKRMGLTEAATSYPVAMTLLAALASGAITVKTLDKFFPRPKIKQQVGPKRIVLKRQSDPSFYESINAETGEANKLAGYDSRNEQDIADDGLEFLVHMCLGNTKVASNSDLHELVGAMLDDRKQELVGNICTLGLDTAMNLCKGAHENIKSAAYDDIGLAVCRLVKTPELQPITALLACSEYENMAPHFCKAAMSQPDAIVDVLARIGGAFGALGRYNTFANSTLAVKNASLLDATGVGDLGIEDLLDAFVAQHEQSLKKKPIDGGEDTGDLAGDDSVLGATTDDPTDQNLLATESDSSEEAASEDENTGETGTAGSIQQKPKIINRASKTKLEADPKDEIDAVFAGGNRQGTI